MLSLSKPISKCLAACFASMAAITTVTAQTVAGPGTWESTLQDRDLDADGVTDAFYDKALNITWLRNADLLGRLTWQEAHDAAAAHKIGRAAGWRLPNMVDTGNPGCDYGRDGTDCGYNVQIVSANGQVYSELAHLYFVTLGNKSIYGPDGAAQSDGGLTNTGKFQGFSGFGYWTDAEAGVGAGSAFYFYTADGAQLVTTKQSQIGILLVHDGDISPVPDMPTQFTLLLGLTVIAWRRKSRAPYQPCTG